MDMANRWSLFEKGGSGGGGGGIFGSSVGTEELEHNHALIPKDNNAEEAAEAEADNNNVGAMGRSSLNVLSFTLIVFYNVSGGPFGIEAAVRAAGNRPLWTVLGFLIWPLGLSLPEALITAELGSTYPSAAGGTRWIEEACGPFVAVVVGYGHWVAVVVRVSLGMEMLSWECLWNSNDNSDNGDGSGDSMGGQGWERYVVLLITATVWSFISFGGLRLVSNTTKAIALVSLTPLILMCVVGLFRGVDATRWIEPVSVVAHNNSNNSIQWGALLHVMVWKLMGFDSGACLSTEVSHTKVLVEGMHWSVLLVTMANTLPLLVTMGVVVVTTTTTTTAAVASDYWPDGHLVTVAHHIIGPWLGRWVEGAAALTHVGVGVTLLTTNALTLFGLVEMGWLPRVFGRRSCRTTPKFGSTTTTTTPLLGTLVGYAAVVVFLIFIMNENDLEFWIELHVFMVVITTVIQYLSFLVLRVKKGDVHRPYRIPLSTGGCVLMLLPSFTVFLFIIITSSGRIFIRASVILFVGLLIYLLLLLSKMFNLCQYVDTPNDFDVPEEESTYSYISPAGEHYTVRFL